LLAGLVVLALAGPVPPASAGGVVSACNEAALRAALNGGSTVTFSADCTIVVSQPIVIKQAATIIDANGHRVTLTSSNAVTLFDAATNLTLKGLSLVNGKSSTSGGALNIRPGVTVIANGCVFAGNSAAGTNGVAGSSGGTNMSNIGDNGGSGTGGISGLGGAIYNQGTLALVNCTLTNNSATGGAGGNGGNGGQGTGTFQVGGNGGDGGDGGLGFGGAVYNLGDLSVINCTFAGNTATGGAGGTGGTAAGGTTAGLSGNGGAGGVGAGGAVFNVRNLSIQGSTFTSNSSRGGASANAGMNGNGSGKGGIRGAFASGGAVYNAWWTAVTNSTFYTNFVIGGAGGNGGNGGGTFNLPGDGGDGGNGIGGSLNNDNSITVVNCTFSSGGTFGGTNGVAGTGSFTGEPGNPGSGVGGNLANGGPSFVVMNSVLAAAAPGNNVFGGYTDAGFNLSSDNTGSPGFQNLDPKLGPLAPNGGPTFTMALLSGSPAINKIPPDAGPPADQRGVARPVNNLSDIGAFEFGASITPSNVVLSISRTASGLFQIKGGGTTGVSYFVQASTNLLAWQTVSTNVAPILYVDPATNFSARFYRVTR
jgi:hypothetical protein